MMQGLLAAGESFYRLDQDWMERTCPDVILTQDLCYFCDVDATVVSDALVELTAQPELVVLSPKNLEEIFGSILQVGDACGADEAAYSLVQSMRDRVQSVVDALVHVVEQAQGLLPGRRQPIGYRRPLDSRSTAVGRGKAGPVPAGLPRPASAMATNPGLQAGKAVYRPLFLRLGPWRSRGGLVGGPTRLESAPRSTSRRSLPHRPCLLQQARTPGGTGPGDTGPVNAPGPIYRADSSQYSGQAGPDAG